jgi:hypothetical protein
VASTFAEVLEFAASNEQEVTTYVDSATPVGHFAAITRNGNDDRVICLLKGEKDDVDARVKGYVLMVFDENDALEVFAYVQDAQANEKPLGRVRSYSGATESFASVFAKMV